MSAWDLGAAFQDENDENLTMLRRMRAAFERAGAPERLHIDVTYRCDLDCVHCYLDEKDRWPEMRTDEVLALLDQAHDAGVMHLTWSGGEVFARPDFMELLEYAGKLGFVQRLKTHGGAIDAPLARRLFEARVHRIDVSVYSLRPEVHDRITQVAGSLDATIAGVRAARGAGVAVKVNSVVFAGNLEEIPAIDDFFAALGCSCGFTANIARDHGGGAELDGLELEGDDIVRAFELIDRTYFARRGKLEVSEQRESWSHSAVCGAGRTSGYITPDGAVWPCVMWPQALGHLREQGLDEIWQSSALRKEILAFRNASRTSCTSCGGRTACAYCPGEAFKRTGDFKQAPRSFHRDARARMVALNRVAPGSYSDEDFASVPAVEPETVERQGRAGAEDIYRPDAAPKRAATSAPAGITRVSVGSLSLTRRSDDVARAKRIAKKAATVRRDAG